MKLKKSAIKFKKPKKVSISSLKKKADIAFSKSLRTIIGYCQANGKTRCKCGGPLQCCHIEGRINKTLRYDPMNILILCAGHHRYFHSHPFEFIEFCLTHFKSQFDYVMQNKNNISQLKEDDYKEIIKLYETQYRQLMGLDEIV